MKMKYKESFISDEIINNLIQSHENKMIKKQNILNNQIFKYRINRTKVIIDKTSIDRLQDGGKNFRKIFDSPIKLYLNLKELTFNFEQFIIRNNKNYKYVDEYGISHSFRLIINSKNTFQDICDENIKLILNEDRSYSIIKKNKILEFDV